MLGQCKNCGITQFIQQSCSMNRETNIKLPSVYLQSVMALFLQLFVSSSYFKFTNFFVFGRIELETV